jgi:hypothetical protein
LLSLDKAGGGEVMFNDLDMLRNSPELQHLLGHYIGASPEDKEAWLDRLMHLEGVEDQDLVKLHGRLIAFSWIEQNSGNTPALRPGSVPSCYRATSAGRRALQLAKKSPAEDEEEALSLVPDDTATKKRSEARFPKYRNGRRGKTGAEERTLTGDPSQTDQAADLPAGGSASEESSTPCLAGDPA